MKSPLIFRIFKSEQIYLVKQFVDRDQILFGHEAEVDIDLDSSEVSSIHCLVEKRGNQFFICDLGSTQGTYKNGVAILDDVINSGDQFNVGPFRIIFFVGAPKPIHSPKTSSEIVIPPAPPVVAAVTAAPAAVVTPTASVTTESQQPAARTEAVKPIAEVKKSESISQATPTKSQAATTTAAKVATVATVGGAVASVTQNRPQIHSAVVGSKVTINRYSQSFRQKTQRGQKTYAPESQITELREYIKPGKGQLVEVIVTWKERILNTYHFAPLGIKKVGPNQEIQIPDGTFPKKWALLDCTQGGVQVRTNAEMKVEVQNADQIRLVTETNYRLQQNEAVFISLSNGMQVIVRFAPAAPAVPFESPLILSSSEFTGILAALIIAALMSLIVSVTVPKAVPQEEEVQRVAQVIFDKPPVELPPPPKPPPVTVPPQPPKEVMQTPPKVKPPEKLKKVTESEKQKPSQTKGDPAKPDQKAQAAQTAGRANEVKPKDSKLKAKMFTSTKQGGAIKTGNQSGANAQSKDPDPTNQGLLSAFGSGGARSKLDKAYSGSGELLGQGEKATGSSGFNENRAGDDLGSKFKDTGAGGKGTATQGIAGIGTKGRGTGMSEYGNGIGFGSKDQVAIQPGGSEEEFVGSIDRDAVRRVVKSALGAFKACYDREYRRNSKLEGKVVISWEIHEKGIAKNAKVLKDKSTLGNTVVEECVRARMLTLRFPEPPAGTVAEVVYPFLFQGQK